MPDEIRWGMIGCGDVTEVKSGPAFRLVEHSDLVAVMRRTGEKACDYAERHGVSKWYDDAGQLLNDPDVNAVYIATPPDSHKEYVLKAAAVGKPVYVEKPMGRTYQECEQMIEACRDAQVPLFVAYYRRCLPDFLKVKELIEDGAIGDVRFVRIELYLPALERDCDPDNLPWRVQPETAGAGLFFDLASHQLDFLDHALGPIADSVGHAANQMGAYPAEDIVSASFKFESGAIGNGAWCFSVPQSCKTDRMEIIGSEGKIAFPFYEAGRVQLINGKGTENFERHSPKHIQQALIQSIVDELRGKGTCPSNGVSGARTNRVMDDILTTWHAA